MEDPPRKSLPRPISTVQIGDSADFGKRKVNRIERLHCLHPQIRKDRKIVSRTTVEVLAKTLQIFPGKVTTV